MAEKDKLRLKRGQGYIGFVACYKGRTIATSRTFEGLANRREVRGLLGNKDLVIKHTVPEGKIAIY
jgi:hypothetical protein